MNNTAISEINTLFIALLSLALGWLLCNKISLFNRYSVPMPVVGGLLTAIAIAGYENYSGNTITFSTGLRDILLLTFFISIGLGAKLKELLAGGRPLFYLCLVTILTLFLQNITGIAIALLFGKNPFYGLLAGSVSFVGGPGTAVAWAEELKSSGLKSAELFAISSATLAVISGSVICGPIVTWIIKKRQLKSETVNKKSDEVDTPAEPELASSYFDWIKLLLVVSLSIFLGGHLKNFAQQMGITLPGFLSALLVSLIIGNIAGNQLKLSERLITRTGDIALQLFLAISLMGLKLNQFGTFILPLLLVVILQILICFLISYFLLFPLLGKTYNTAVVIAGFIGFSVSSMPVAMAQMNQLTRRFGPAPSAILLITLCGSFFVDLANAVVVTLFVSWIPAIFP